MASILQLNFDIDDYLNRIVPSPPWRFIPYPVSYLLGHRKGPPEKKYGSLLLLSRAMIGIFISLVLIQFVSHQIPWVASNGPRIVASFGAAAVLEFYTVDAPLAQPRNSVLSQAIGTVIGVSFFKLFRMHSEEEYVRWMGGALACATTTVLMGLTKTVHPPAGATALLAVIDDTAAALGWKLIPLVLLGCTIMLGVALILNNICGRFPLYWWTASDLETLPVVEKLGTSTPSLRDTALEKAQPVEITIVRGQVIVPPNIELSPEEKLLLERISSRL
ncbi:HPP family-domain-containing protein [Xylaria nigripes]|nr:HPP family-domain-containing protein [Xylaria nigripes]